MAQYIFYILAAVILIFAVMSVTTRRVLRAAVYLLFSLACTAGIYFMVEYFFLAAVQLLVYVGGIVVLIIFSILLTSQINDRLEKPGMMKSLGTAFVVLVGAGFTLFAVTNYNFKDPVAGESPTVNDIGVKLLSYGEGGYVLPFEVISILLLAAMIGAIIIAKRVKEND